MLLLGARTFRVAGISLGLVLAALLLYAVAVEPNRLVERRVTLACSGLRGSPVRFLLISDLDFTGEGHRERSVRKMARRFDPDLVLIAGDFLDRKTAFDDPRLMASAHDYLRSLPASSGRFLVPGEEEADLLDDLRRSWEGLDGVRVLANEACSLDVGGEAVDLYGADPTGDSAPWGLRTDGERSFIEARGWLLDREMTYRGPGAFDWTEVEISVVFQVEDQEALFELRFAWPEDLEAEPPDDSGWRLVRERYRPLRLSPRVPPARSAKGRRNTGFVPPTGVWCQARIRLSERSEGSRIRVRLWQTGTPEPEQWALDIFDRGSERRLRGTIGLAGHQGARVADLRVTGLEGEVLLDETFDDPARLATLWRSPSSLADWLREPGPARARVLLTHNPDLVVAVADAGGFAPCAVLAGHTHGGQVRLPGVGALFTGTDLGRDYGAGLFDYRGIPLYITPGVGTSLIPMRLLSPPEVTLLTLVPEGP